MTDAFPYTGVALDLDGVVCLGDEAIPGAPGAIRRLQESKVPVIFVTNMSAMTQDAQRTRLGRMGIDADGSVVTSSMAAASLLRAGEKVLVCGGPGVSEAVEAAGADPFDGTARAAVAVPEEVEGFDAVVVGYHTDFDYRSLARAARSIKEGARLIGTNHDPTVPTEHGLAPGGGAILAAIATASEREPEIAGKPHEPIAQLVSARLGPRPLMVGDRPDTDGDFATRLGCDFALVLTGVVQRADLPVEPRPAHVADDLAALVDDLCG